MTFFTLYLSLYDHRCLHFLLYSEIWNWPLLRQIDCLRLTQISSETSALKRPCCPVHHDPQTSMQVLENHKQARSMVGSHILNLWDALFLNSSKLEALPVTFSNSQRFGFPTCNQMFFLFSKHFLLYISLLCCICLSIYSFRPAGGFWLIKKPPVSTCHF